MKKLDEAISPNDKIDVLFLSILNRMPTSEETRFCMAELSPAATKPLDYYKNSCFLLWTEIFFVVKFLFDKYVAWG